MNNIPEHCRRSIQKAKNEDAKALYLFSSEKADDQDKLTKIPEEVFELTNLRILMLNNNRISELPESLGNLTNLTRLDLRKNQISSLPESIGNLINLTDLILEFNQLSSVPESIGNLTNLTNLDLSDNKISSLPESLGNLTNLDFLCLAVNQLSSLPESLGNLTNLTKLELRVNQLSSLPESLGNLTNLIYLYLSYNKISSLPESLGNLTNLKSLYLAENQISYIPESLGKLNSLNQLDLSDNKISYLPESFINLTNLTRICLDANPLKVEPLRKIIGTERTIEAKKLKRRSRAIKKYFRQLREGSADYIYEAKLIILGEAGAGKTTLARKIDNPDYQLKEDEKSTEGIDITQWAFPFLGEEKETRNFKVNIWDFGGQEIYKHTHKFFLTKRSLYILVADTRKEDTDFYYWLNVVELLSDNSPLLIIKNEKQDRKWQINETTLRGIFTNLEKVFATNLATNRGLEEIITNIKHYIQELPLIRETLPKTWVKVRQFLENDSRNCISLQEYLDICDKNEFTRHEDKLQLSQYLHDLGVCLHFQDEEDSLLYKTVILKPTWGTEAVYKVLDNREVINNQGCFTRNDLKNIWQEEKYALMRGELLELMKKFQLCYEIPNRKDTFIAPQLLSDNQPEYPWDKSNNLILRYAYPDFMPKGIITRFIVVMHKHIDQQKYVWKSGVILDKENTKAEVIEYYGKRGIQIRISGDNKRNFMTVVTHELDKINNSFKRLKYQKLIPCNCEVCKDNQLPHFYSYETLKKFIKNRQQYIQCQESFQMINVFSLIDDAVDLNELFGNKDQGIDREKEFLKEIVKIQASREIKAEAKAVASEGNTYNQEKVGIGHMSGGKMEGDIKVADVINEAEKQDLTQAAEEIQTLLEQLSQTNPTTTNREKMAVAGEAVDIIEAKPDLKTKVVNALKSGGTEAFKEAVNHPLVNVLVAMIEGWQE